MAVVLRLTIEDLGVGAALDRIRRAGGDLTVLMRRIGAVLEASVADRFETGEGPGGARWPVSQSARERGHPTLVQTGLHLRDGIVTEAGPRSVEIGTNLPWAAAHQFGAEIRPVSARALAFRLPDGRLVQVGKVTLPARPFLGFDARDEAEIAAEAEDWLAELAR